MATGWSIVEVVDLHQHLVNQKVQKILMPVEAIQPQRESCSEGIQAFDYSLRRRSSCEDLHENGVVILDSE